MTSKTVRRDTRRRSFSMYGRPRKEGERYPGGKLKPPPPNEVVIAKRRAMLGVTDLKVKVDLSQAENPMSLALARGWITEQQHRQGVALATAYRISRVGMTQRVTATAAHEAPDRSAIDKRPIGEMGDAAIGAAWDAMARSTQRPERTLEVRKAALGRYLKMTAKMTAGEHHQVFRCFVLQEWPIWIDQRINSVSDPRAEREFSRLVAGLDALAKPTPLK